jgi:hypothetical protein
LQPLEFFAAAIHLRLQRLELLLVDEYLGASAGDDVE